MSLKLQFSVLLIVLISSVTSTPTKNLTLENGKQQITFRNPIIDGNAGDPSVIKLDGSYYLVYTQGNRIDIVKSPILTDFRIGERTTAYWMPQWFANLWAPELHFIRGELYIYFTMDQANWPNDETHRMYVIKADDPKNPMGSWSQEVRLLPDEEIYAIDGTVLQYGNGELYFIWTGFPNPPGSMNIYIAKMDSPMSVNGPRILIKYPQFDWEMNGYPVNEGPFIVQNAGRTFLIFSASSTFTADYCLGMMGIDDLKDPLVPGNWWNDIDHCVFHRNDAENVFTTGHASFVRSPDDTELWVVYHATNDINDNGVHRTARVQKLDWAPDNAPVFPAAAGLDRDLLVPSGQF